jgi:hypothetical protein
MYFNQKCNTDRHTKSKKKPYDHPERNGLHTLLISSLGVSFSFTSIVQEEPELRQWITCCGTMRGALFTH